MKKTLFILSIITMITGCTGTRKEQKMWICESLPIKVWEGITYNALNSEYQRLVQVMAEFADEEIEKFYDQSVYAENLDRSLFGDNYYDASADLMMQAFFGVGLGQSAQRDRKQSIKNYKERYKNVVELLKNNLSICLTYKDSSFVECEHYSDEEIFNTLIGNVKTAPITSEELAFDIAKDITNRILCALEKPVVSSCNYDKEKDFWIVRMDNAETQFVKFFKEDDGDTSIEYSSDSHEWDH